MSVDESTYGYDGGDLTERLLPPLLLLLLEIPPESFPVRIALGYPTRCRISTRQLAMRSRPVMDRSMMTYPAQFELSVALAGAPVSPPPQVGAPVTVLVLVMVEAAGGAESAGASEGAASTGAVSDAPPTGASGTTSSVGSAAPSTPVFRLTATATAGPVA